MYQVELANAKKFAASDEMTLLESARAGGVSLEYSCRSGRCGVCKAAVLMGETRAIKAEESLSDTELKSGAILTCCRVATSDLLLDIEDLGRLASIQVKTLPCRIDELQLLADGVMQVFLRLPPTAAFDYLAGQYIDVIARGGVRRSYSIANAGREDGRLELHIAKVADGVMSAYWFNEAKINDLLRLEGPLGTFCFRDAMPRHIVFLATGTGIAPVKAMLEDFSASPEKSSDAIISVYWGGRWLSDMYWPVFVSGLDIRFHPVLSRADEFWQGQRGYVQDALLADQIDLGSAVVYACGSDAMIHSARTALMERGLPVKRFYSDAFVCSDICSNG